MIPLNPEEISHLKWDEVVEFLRKSGHPAIGFSNGLPEFEPGYKPNWDKIRADLLVKGVNDGIQKKDIPKKAKSTTGNTSGKRQNKGTKNKKGELK